MPRMEFIEGQIFGTSTFLKELAPIYKPSGQPKRRGLFKCKCGKEFEADIHKIKSGKNKTCGCETGGFKHGHARNTGHSPEYQSYYAMLQRCYNPNCIEYFRYGGKGITVCKDWKSSFVKFFKDIGRKPSPIHTLDRYPNRKGNYEPNNCRWATPLEQAINKDSTPIIKFNGKEHCLSEWANILDMDHKVLRYRINVLKWPSEKAFTAPIREDKKYSKY